LHNLVNNSKDGSVYVKLRGNVSCPLPQINVEGKTGPVAIHYKLTYARKFSGFTQTWHSEVPIQSREIFRAPWSLTDGVNEVKIPITVTPELKLIRTTENDTGYPIVSALLCFIPVLNYPYKYVHTERVLEVGTSLFAVGKVTKSTSGLEFDSPPIKSFFKGFNAPFIVTEQLESEVINNFENKGTQLELAACTFGISGLLLLAWSLYRGNK